MKNSVLLLTILLSAICSSKLLAQQQRTVEFRISTVASNVCDLDGAFNNSDPQWDFAITDDSYGSSDNDSHEQSGTNNPGTITLNTVFFSQTFDCSLPASYTFVWSGFEDDGLGSDANTGPRTVSIPSSSINPAQTTFATIGTYTHNVSGFCGGGA